MKKLKSLFFRNKLKSLLEMSKRYSMKNSYSICLKILTFLDTFFCYAPRYVFIFRYMKKIYLEK